MSGSAEIAPGIVVSTASGFGRPVIKGTEVEVAAILGRLAAGASFDEVEGQYRITRASVLDALTYAYDIIKDEHFSLLRREDEATIEVAPGVTMDPRVRFGKPVLQGTRLDVATILGLLSAGEEPQAVAEAYSVPTKGVLAALGYAAGLISSETVSAI
jgi:uncharacterized protein (DUF433 family)